VGKQLWRGKIACFVVTFVQRMTTKNGSEADLQKPERLQYNSSNKRVHNILVKLKLNLK